MAPIEADMIGALGLVFVVLGALISGNTNFYGLALIFLGGILVAIAIRWGR